MYSKLSRFRRHGSFWLVLIVASLFLCAVVLQFSDESNKPSVSEAANKLYVLEEVPIRPQEVREESESLEDQTSAVSYLDVIKERTGCLDKPNEKRIDRRGNFWVLKNYVTPDGNAPRCHETITYTTHVDFTFLDNLEPLVTRWQAPVGVAIYAPGTDYQKALESVFYVRKCLKNSQLIREFVTFHIFFDREHTPSDIIQDTKEAEESFPCVVEAPYISFNQSDMYKTQKKLFYPINVARNIAREAATTHFVLASDIELYPNPGVVESFLKMYASLNETRTKEVFVFALFEVEKNATIPETKTELQAMLRNKTAIQFHAKICPNCHSVPKGKEWIAANSSSEMRIFSSAKRQGDFFHWEPIFIGTNNEPYYEEVLHWEGKSDKMTQGYTLCILDYDFHVMSEAFLVHKPGIKKMSEARREKLENEARNVTEFNANISSALN